MGTLKGGIFPLVPFCTSVAPQSFRSSSFLCFPLGRHGLKIQPKYLISNQKIKPQSVRKSQATLQYLTASLPNSVIEHPNADE